MIKKNLLILPITYVVLFLIIPLLFFYISVGGIDFSVLSHNKSLIRFTILQALYSAILTTLLGLPGAYLVSRTKMPKLLKRTMQVLSSVPFVLPGITMAMGFFLTFGRNGLYNRIFNLFGFRVQFLYTFTAVLLGHVFYNFPLFIRIVGNHWSEIDGNIIEASKIDGAGKFKTFLFVELPQLIPSILNAFLLTYIYCFTSFSVVMILGGVRYSTIEVAIYTYSRTLLDFKSAATLSIFQLVFISFVAYILSIKKLTHKENYNFHFEKFPKWGILYIAFVVLFVFVPLTYSVISGFVDYNGRFSLNNFSFFRYEEFERIIGSTVQQMIFYTFLIATLSTFLALLISFFAGYFSSRGFKLGYLMVIPAAVSSVTIATAYLNIPIPNVLKIALVHSLITLPIIYGILESGWRGISNEILETAKTEGASFKELILEIILPVIRRSLAVALIYGFTISVGETSATLTLAESPVTTLSISIFRLMSTRNTEIAMVLNTFYSSFVLFLFVLMEIFPFESNLRSD